MDPRSAALKEATRDRVWDIIVIGGGASGLAAAVEAASRGYTTLLLEGHDYAKGTSSRSTKMIHGGVRYLAQGNARLVRDSLHERGVLRRNAPHLVQDMGLVVPAYRKWQLPFYAAGLKLYDLLAGRHNLRPSRMLKSDAVQARIGTLKSEDLRGGVLYFDAQFDDSRLAITLLRTFQALGGVALNAAPVTGLTKKDGRVTGVTFRDSETGHSHAVRARTVVNATGVFADALRRLDDPAAQPMLTPSQGVHIVVPRRFLPGDTALIVPKTEDGRVLFCLPWHGRTLIGTTDTPVTEVSLEPKPLEAEIDFLLRTAAAYLDPAPQRSDILSQFAGLRPLVRAGAGDGQTKSLARDHLITVSPSGLVTVMGGKWTTCRRMGEDVIDRAARSAGLPGRQSRSDSLRLHGWTEVAADAPWRVYGTDAAAIQALPGAQARLHPDLPYVEAQVRWAVRHEQARSVEDVLARRLRALFLDAQAAMAMAPRVAELMAEELGRDAAWSRAQIADFSRLARTWLPR